MAPVTPRSHVTIAEAAKIMNRSPHTVYAYVVKGMLVGAERVGPYWMIPLPIRLAKPGEPVYTIEDDSASGRLDTSGDAEDEALPEGDPPRAARR